MAISYIGAGALVAQTTDNATAAYPAGLVGDIALGLFTTKPATISGTAYTDTFLGYATSGTVAAGNDQGSVRAAALCRITTATSSGSIPITYAGNNVTGGQGLRFRSSISGAIWSPDQFSLEDQVETGTTVSASGTISAGGVASGDTIVIHVALKSDAINHTAQSITVAGATIGTITWLSKSLSTAGGDMAMYLGYATVTAGSSTGTATYTATSSVSGGSATAVNLVRLREVIPPNAPTGLAATLNVNNVGLAWTAPSSGTAPTSYNIFRSHAVTNIETFTTDITDWSASSASLNTISWSSSEQAVQVTSISSNNAGAWTSQRAIPAGATSIEVRVNAKWNTGTPKFVVLSVLWYDAAQTSTPGAGTSILTNTTSYVNGTASYPIPSTAVTYRIRVFNNAAVVNDSFFIGESEEKFTYRSNIGSVSAPTTTYSDTTGLAQTTYTYVVRSSTSVAESVDSNSSSATTGNIVLSYAMDADSINLSWNQPAGTTPTSYKIVRTTGNHLMGDSATFTSGVGTWVSGTLVTVSHEGATGRLLATRQSSGTYALSSEPTAGIPVQPGDTVNAGADARLVSGTNFTLRLQFYTPTGDFVASVISSPLTQTSMALSEVSGTAPAGASYAVIALAPFGSPSSMEIDNAYLTTIVTSTVSSSTNSYEDTNVIYGKTYIYQVTPVFSGVEHTSSNSIVAALSAIARVIWKGLGSIRPWLSSGEAPWKSS